MSLQKSTFRNRRTGIAPLLCGELSSKGVKVAKVVQRITGTAGAVTS